MSEVVGLYNGIYGDGIIGLEVLLPVELVYVLV